MNIEFKREIMVLQETIFAMARELKNHKMQIILLKSQLDKLENKIIKKEE